MSQPARARESTGYLSTKDVDEELARLFLASALRAPVTVHDRRSGHSTYDLEIRYPDGRRGAAEVVSTRTQKQTAQLDAVRRAGYTADSRLKHSWIARVPPATRISRVHPVLPEFLAELERIGITDLNSYGNHGPGMRDRLRGLHVSSCLAYAPTGKHPPGFYIYPEATACWVGDGEEIPRFCEDFLSDLAQSDVLGKLARSGADERHAIVIATLDQFGLYTAVDMGLTPSHAPDLSTCIDGLWVIASQAPPVQGCYWTRPTGWTTTVLTANHTPPPTTHHRSALAYTQAPLSRMAT
jgi:hypothetical protein